MLRELLTRITDAAKIPGKVVVRRVREAIKPKSALGGLIADLTRTREELESENTSLRQQVILLSRGMKRPKIKPIDRVVHESLRFRCSAGFIMIIEWRREDVPR